MALARSQDYVAGNTIEPGEVDAEFNELYAAIGTQVFTEQNYVATDQTATASLDALDMQLKNVSNEATNAIAFCIGPHEVISGSDASTCNGLFDPSNHFAYPHDVNGAMMFPFAIPVDLHEKTMTIDSITVFFNTQENGDYISVVTLRQYDLDGTVTDLITHTDDLGNGSTGTASHNIVDVATALADKPTALFFTNICDVISHLRIYGIIVKGHVA